MGPRSECSLYKAKHRGLHGLAVERKSDPVDTTVSGVSVIDRNEKS